MKPIAIACFPGTNCDRDMWQAVKAAGLPATWWWHENQYDAITVAGIILPGGFSYGDYLRSGALAAKSPVMKSIAEGVRRGLPVLGSCNGFQILCEAGLLPGVLVRNEGQRFVDQWVTLCPQPSRSVWAKVTAQGKSLQLPIAHGDGRFYANEAILKKLWDREQIWFTYEKTPNGSLDSIAGVLNETGNVAGFMPHPERACFNWMGSLDGLPFFKIFLEQL